MTINRNVGEDRVIQDNLTRLVGKHSIKVGYEMIWTLYSDKASSLPSGQYNFGGGTSLPFTPNTGIDFAAFEMGAVTSATFTRPQGHLPAAAVGSRTVLPGRLESAAQSVAEPGPALDLLLPVQNQIRPAVAVRPGRDRPGDRTEGSDHPSQGHHRQARSEQLPAAHRTVLELPCPSGSSAARSA